VHFWGISACARQRPASHSLLLSAAFNSAAAASLLPSLQLISSSFLYWHSMIHPDIFILSHGESIFDFDALKCPCLMLRCSGTNRVVVVVLVFVVVVSAAAYSE
jgi:hypothetical protein